MEETLKTFKINIRNEKYWSDQSKTTILDYVWFKELFVKLTTINKLDKERTL